MRCFIFFCLSDLSGPGGLHNLELVLPDITWDMLILKKCLFLSTQFSHSISFTERLYFSWQPYPDFNFYGLRLAVLAQKTRWPNAVVLKVCSPGH